MVRQRQGDLDILPPVMPRALVVLRVPVGAVVLAAASVQALAGVKATGQALAGVELTLHGEAGSVIKGCSKDNVTMFSYAIKKFFGGGIYYARIKWNRTHGCRTHDRWRTRLL
jgi:hypothetical protein